MKKILAGVVMVFSLLPILAFAQVGDVNPNPTTSCVSITHNLAYGSRDSQTGGDVSNLQFFLQSKGYLNSDPTGYFGLLTEAAVKSFQSASGVLNSGYVGPITRGKISAICGTNPTIPTPSPVSIGTPPVCPLGALFNSATGAPCTNPVPTSPTSPPSASQPTITRICALASEDSQVYAGQRFCIEGTNFSAPDSVYVGNTLATVTQESTSEGNGKYLIWAVAPNGLVSGSSYVTVGNVNGTSNQYAVTVIGSVSGVQNPAPVISTITPNQGTGNTALTIYGTNLTGATAVDFYSGNTLMAGISQLNVTSGGQSLNFALSGAFGGMVAAGTYQVEVVTPSGTSNGLNFVFTPTATNAPYISAITPSQGTTNSVISIYGTNLTGATAVDFYNSSYQMVMSIDNVAVSSGGSPLQFTINGVDLAMEGPGTYQIKVVTPSGTSNGLNFVITAPSSNAPTISTISPSQGTANTVVTINGTNLTGATSVNFYNSSNQMVMGMNNVTVSNNGSQLQFTISGVGLAMEGPGTYQIRVVTPSGTSNTVSLTLTQ